ncbi:MAG: hypothetical protein AAFV07_11990 [Bacteroidota bacterium]
MESFHHHLESAIEINERRKPIYAEATHDISLPLSRQLIAWERALLPFARFMDKLAEPFIEEGVNVVSGDFVPMEPLPPVDQPPRFRKIASDRTCERLESQLRHVRRYMSRKVRKGDYDKASSVAAEFLMDLDGLEPRVQSHFAMTRHLVESVAFATLHAPLYMKQSDGETEALSRRLIMSQLQSLRLCLRFDQMAQASHVMQAGILVNDLPHIPFLKEWKQ